MSRGPTKPSSDERTAVRRCKCDQAHSRAPARRAGAANQTGVCMGKRAKGAGHDSDEPDIRALEMMLDYAIIEGAALRLPLFVLLLRTARLELMSSIEAYGGLCDRRVETKITDC